MRLGVLGEKIGIEALPGLVVTTGFIDVPVYTFDPFVIEGTDTPGVVLLTNRIDVGVETWDPIVIADAQVITSDSLIEVAVETFESLVTPGAIGVVTEFVDVAVETFDNAIVAGPKPIQSNTLVEVAVEVFKPTVVEGTEAPNPTVTSGPRFIDFYAKRDDVDKRYRGIEIEYTVNGGGTQSIPFWPNRLRLWGDVDDTYVFRYRNKYERNDTISSVFYNFDPSDTDLCENGPWSKWTTGVDILEADNVITPTDTTELVAAFDTADTHRRAGETTFIDGTALAGLIVRPHTVDSGAGDGSYEPIIDMTQNTSQSSLGDAWIAADLDVSFRGSIVDTGSWTDVSATYSKPAGTIFSKAWTQTFGFRSQPTAAQTGIVLAKDQLHIDGIRLTHFKAPGAETWEDTGHTLTNCLDTAGSFYVDEDASTVFMHVPSGKDPNSDVVERAVCKSAIKVTGQDNFVLKGFDLRHTIDTGDSEAAIFAANCNHFVCKDLTVAHSNYYGIKSVGASGDTTSALQDFYLHGCNASNNGGNGYGAYRIRDIYYIQSPHDINGWRGWLAGYYGYNVTEKTNEVSNVWVWECTADGNYGHGQWFDLNCEWIFQWRSTWIDNQTFAEWLESNHGPIISRNCIFAGNAIDSGLAEIEMSSSRGDFRGCLFKNTGDRAAAVMRLAGNSSRHVKQSWDPDSEFYMAASTIADLNVGASRFTLPGDLTAKLNDQEVLVQIRIDREGGYDVYTQFQDAVYGNITAGRTTVYVNVAGLPSHLSVHSDGDTAFIVINQVPVAGEMVQNVFDGFSAIYSTGSGGYWANYFGTLDTDWNLYWPNDPSIAFGNASQPNGHDFATWQAALAGRAGKTMNDGNSVVADPGEYTVAVDDWLDDITANMLPSTVPAPTLDLLVPGDTNVTAYWTDPPVLNCDVIEVYGGLTTTPETLIDTVPWGTGQFTIEGLTNGVPYYVRLKASATPGYADSGYSNTLNATPLELIGILGSTKIDAVAGGAGTISVGVNVPAGTSLMHMGFISDPGGAGGLVSRITSVLVDGEAATRAGEGIKNFDIVAESYYKLAPTIGNINVDIAVNSGTVVHGFFVFLSNAEALDVEAGNGWETGQASASVNYDPNDINTVAIATYGDTVVQDPLIVPAAGQTILQTQSIAGQGFTSQTSYERNPTGAADAMGFSGTAAASKKAVHIAVYSLNAVAGTVDLFTVDVNEGGETTDFTFTAVVTANDWIIDRVEARLTASGPVVVELVDQGGGIWEGTTQLLPNVYEGIVAVAVNWDASEAVSGDDEDITVYATPEITSHEDEDTGVPVDDVVSWIPSGGLYDFQVATDTGFTSLVMNITGLGDAFDTLAGLTLGVEYFMRVRDVASDWSDVVSFTTSADSTAPTFSAGPTVDNLAETTLSVDATIDEDGTIYVVVVDDGDPTPNSAEVKAGQASGGGSPVASGSAAATASVEATINITGLTAESPYDVYVVAEDGVPNLQASPVKVDTTTPDTTAPTFSVAPAVDSFDDTSITIDATINEAGTIYAVAVLDGASAPSVTEVLAGQASGGGAPEASGNVAAAASTEESITLTGLDAETAYDIYVAAKDDTSPTPNQQATPVKLDQTTDEASSFVSRWAVAVDDKARLQADLTSNHEFNGATAVCMWRFIPTSLAATAAVDYIVDYGFDPSANQGWTARTATNDNLLVRVGYGTNEYNLGNVAMTDDTEYKCAVYIVDGTVYFRVNGTEVANSSNGIATVSTFPYIRLFAKNASGGGDSLNSYAQKFLVLKGGYNADPATALAEVRADIAAYEALTPTDQLQNASFTGTVVQRCEMDESSDAATSTPRVDTSGNGYDFADQYHDFGDQAWIASIDNSAI